MATKGQNIRLYLNEDDAFIAGATSCSVNIQLDMQDASTKDSTNGWEEQEPVGISWDVSTDALVFDADPVTGGSGSVLADMVGLALGGIEDPDGVQIEICAASGDNNRTKGTSLLSGNVLVTGLTINAQNRQNATYTASFTGKGSFT